MKKTLILPVIILTFMALASPAKAFIEDDFESYPLGPLASSSDWTGNAEVDYVGGSEGQAVYLFHSSGSSDGSAISRVDNATSTAIFRYQGFEYWRGEGLGYAQNIGVGINSVGIQIYSGTISFNYGFIQYGSPPSRSGLDNGKIMTAINCQTEQFWIMYRALDGQEPLVDEGDWYGPYELDEYIRPYCAGTTPDSVSISNGAFWGYFGAWVDNFSNHLPALPYGTYSETEILPVYPVDCEYTFHGASGTPPTIDFTAEVNLNNPDNSSTTWSLIYFNYQDLYSGVFTQFYQNFYSQPDSITNITKEISLASSTYSVSYSLAGNNIDTGWLTYSSGHTCEMTYIGLVNVPEVLAIENMPAFTPEDCSGYSILERLVCEIRNDLKGMFFPSPSKINALKQNINLIGNKFPFNYISVIKNFFNDVSSGLTANEAISISIFGSTAGDLSFSPIASTTRTYGGSTLSILDFIKGFFTLLIFLIILKWFISYVKRIFK